MVLYYSLINLKFIVLFGNTVPLTEVPRILDITLF